MDFRILGDLRVLDSEQEVTLGGDRQRRVLAVLLVNRGERVSAERLLGEVWGEDQPTTAATSLQVAVGKLRKVLGPGTIKTITGGYLLDVSASEVDAVRFETAVAGARAAARRGDMARAADLLRGGLSLWRGDAYADVVAGGVTAAEAARLDELRVGAVEELLEARLTLGEHGELVPELTELVAEHRYRERFHRQLILALYRSGRQADALAAYSRVRDLLIDELGIDTTPELAALERQILGHDSSLAAPAAVHHVRRFPASPTGLVGRDAELDQLVAMVTGNKRIVTVTGPGGVGKTRLCLALLERLSDKSGDPVDLFFVDLAPLAASHLMLPTLANSLGVSERSGTDLLELVVEALQRRRSLVVMDNFESVLEAGITLAEVVAGCPRLSVVVTSRERLSLAGEHEFILSPLPLPASGSEGESAAVQLFCERVVAVRRGFVLDNTNMATVAELCRQLDGLPLALELAAARSKLLTPAALLERLSSDQLGILSAGARDFPVRHQTLARTIAWSYDHLDPVEQYVLQVSSVFAGGATLRAIGYVADLDDERTLTVVGSLVDKSLLTTDLQAADDVRVRMLDTIRHFAARQLTRSGREPEVRNLHATWFADLAETTRSLVWSNNAAVSTSVEPDDDNLRAALSWMLDQADPQDGAKMTAALTHYWRQRAATAAWVEWLMKAVDVAEAGSAAGAALNVAMALVDATKNGAFGDRYALLGQSLATLRRSGDMLDYCNALTTACEIEGLRGQRDAAMDAATDAVAVARTLELPRLLALTLAKLAVSLAARGDLDAARVAMDEALRTAPPNISDASSAGVLLALSWVAILNGEYEAARDRLLSVEDLSVTSSREVSWQMSFRVNLAWAELGLGNARQALEHAAAVAVVVDKIGARSWRLETLVVLAASLAECGDVGLAGVVLGKAALAVKADHDAVDDYVINAYTTALAAAEGPDLAANMKRGTDLTITELAALVRAPAAVRAD